MTNWKAWTPAEDFIIQNAQKLSAAELVELLPGRTLEGINSRRLRLGCRPKAAPPWTPDEDEQLRDMHAEGMGYLEIAATLGRTRAAIKGRLRFLAKDEIQAAATPRNADPWPELPPNAFQDVKVKADPAVQLSKPVDRTLAGVGTAML